MKMLETAAYLLGTFFLNKCIYNRTGVSICLMTPVQMEMALEH